MSDMPLLVRLLWKNQNVFSKSWLRDWFVVVKNRHAFFSVFLCHPQHPFSWKERSVLITCVMMFGYALATGAEVVLTKAEDIALENAPPDVDAAQISKDYRDFKEKNGAAITLFGSIVVQAFYDTFAKWFFVCGCAEMACVTKRPKAKKYCDNAGHFAGCLVFTIALSCALFTLYTNSEEYRDGSVEIDCSDGVTPDKAYNEVCKFDMGGAMKTFGYSRMFSFLGSTTGVLTVMFMFKRSINIRRIPCKKGEMVKLKADDAPSEAMRVREKKGRVLVITRGTYKEETDDDFKKRRDENEWRFPTYDELGPHPPLEPSIFSNTFKRCQSKVKDAPASAEDVEKGGVLEHKEYYLNGEWVGWSKVKEAPPPGNTTAAAAMPTEMSSKPGKWFAGKSIAPGFRGVAPHPAHATPA